MRETPAREEIVKAAGKPYSITPADQAILQGGRIPSNRFYFDYDQYDQYNRWPYPRFNSPKIQAEIETFKPQCIIDIGCGSGSTTLQDIAHSDEKVECFYGCDTSPEAIKALTKEKHFHNIGNKNPQHIYIHQGPIQSLNLPQTPGQKRLFLARGCGIGNIEDDNERTKFIMDIVDAMQSGDRCLIEYFCQYQSQDHRVIELQNNTKHSILSLLYKCAETLGYNKKQKIDEGYRSRKEATIQIYKDNKEFYKKMLKYHGQFHDEEMKIHIEYDDTRQAIIVRFDLNTHRRAEYSKERQSQPRQLKITNAITKGFGGVAALYCFSQRFSSKDIADLCKDIEGIRYEIIDGSNPFIKMIAIQKE